MHVWIDPSQRLADWGPRYAETDVSRFPVEPWATWTNLVFLFAIVYWTWRLRGQYRRHSILTIALPLLTAGWFGGTVYHATRSHPVWLLMDWMPIVLLMLLASGWMWRRLVPSPGLACVATLAPLLAVLALARSLANTGPAGISLSYALIAASVLVPAALNAARNRTRAWIWLVVVVLCFAAALMFRLLDARLSAAGWPHGSHYLWHLFGGAATFCMFRFLFELRTADPKGPEDGGATP